MNALNVGDGNVVFETCSMCLCVHVYIIYVYTQIHTYTDTQMGTFENIYILIHVNI